MPLIYMETLKSGTDNREQIFEKISKNYWQKNFLRYNKTNTSFIEQIFEGGNEKWETIQKKERL